MVHKIASVKAKEGLVICATFLDGTVKEYDLKRLIERYPHLELLKDKKLFNNVQVDVGGYGVFWNDDLDLEAETIWESGIETSCVVVDVKHKVASRLTEARTKMGMTQRQLAEKTGIYQADISKIERGLSNPSINTLEKLARGMGMTVEFDFK